jgi:hypothetical protein
VPDESLLPRIILLTRKYTDIISKLQAISKPFIPKHSILVIKRNDIGYSETRLG